MTSINSDERELINTDYLIVGVGLSGSALGIQLLRAGFKVLSL